MTATEVLQYLQKEIHSTVAATVDDDGLPAERSHSGGLSVKNPFSHMICAFAATSKAAIGFADRHKK